MRVVARFALPYAGWLALMLAGLEILLRIGLATPRHQHFDPVLGSVREPGRRVVTNFEGYSVSHTNSAGFFDDEPARTPPRFRGVLFGDSYAEALQVARAQRFATLLEHRIDGLEILNAGISGGSPPLYVRLAREQDVRRDVAIVLLEDGDVAQSFDPSSLHLERIDPRGPGAARGWRLAPADRSRTFSLLQRALRPLTSHSAIANLAVRNGRAAVETRFGPPPDANASDVDPAEATDAVAWALAEIARVAATVLVVYLPEVEYRGGCRLPASDEREILAAAAARNGMAFLDPTRALCDAFAATGRRGQGFHNAPFVEHHLNADGHRVLAQALTGPIQAAIR